MLAPVLFVLFEKGSFAIKPRDEVRGGFSGVEQLSVDVEIGLGRLLSLEDEWQRLIATNPGSSPYCNWSWVLGWIRAFRKGREFLTLVCRNREQEIVAIVPFTWQKLTSPLEVRKLWMLGFHSGIRTNGLTEEPIYALDLRDASQEAIWTSIHARLRTLVEVGSWDSVAYRRFGNGPEQCSVLASEVGTLEVRDFHRGCEYIQLPETWEEYLKMVSKSMRENIPYYRKKFIKAGIDYRVETLDPNETADGLQRLIDLHKLRTYSDASQEHFDYFAHASSRKLAFEALEEMTQRGAARLVVLRANDEIIAAQVFLQNGHTLLAHYSGFDPAWSKFSPLFVLQSEVFREAISQGYRTVNLLRGNAEWQRRWAANATNRIIDVTIARRSTLSRIRQKIRHQEGTAIRKVSQSQTVRKVQATVFAIQTRKAS